MDGAALEAKLRQRLGFGLDPRLAALREETGGLLDRGALLLMVADEEGLLPAQATLDLGEFQPKAVAEVVGTLERLTPTRTFRRQDGTTGFVCDADLRTSAGVARVVLWDDAVRLVQGLQGRSVRLTRLTERSRAQGAELHSTRETEITAA